MVDLVVVAKTADVKPGQMKSFAVNDKRVLIANWEGTFFATQDLCTHDNGTLADGELDDGEEECRQRIDAEMSAEPWESEGQRDRGTRCGRLKQRMKGGRES